MNSQGNLVVFSRGSTPFLEFNSDGEFIRSFGQEGLVRRAHGLHLEADNTIWVTDVADHVVMKLDQNGNELMTIGTRGESGEWDEAAGAICSSNLTTWHWILQAISMWPRVMVQTIPEC